MIIRFFQQWKHEKRKYRQLSKEWHALTTTQTLILYLVWKIAVVNVAPGNEGELIS